MPSKTPRQRRFMEGCASDKGRAKMGKKCPPKRVAQDFRAADRAKARNKGKSKR